MRKVIGFSFFCIAGGMFLMMLIPKVYIGLIVIIFLLLAGYNLFFCGKFH